MKHRLVYIAVLVMAITGAGMSYAGDGGKHSRYMHYTYSDWAYFSGGGFMSHPESYGGKTMLASRSIATANVKEAGMPAGHQFSPQDFLYFSGEGFSSGNK